MPKMKSGGNDKGFCLSTALYNLSSFLAESPVDSSPARTNPGLTRADSIQVLFLYYIVCLYRHQIGKFFTNARFNFTSLAVCETRS